MAQDNGASLRDRAFVHSASSPQAVSPVPASIPSAILLLLVAGCTPADFGSKCPEQEKAWTEEHKACVASLPDEVTGPNRNWGDDAREACKNVSFYRSYRACVRPPAQGMSAGTAETAQQAQGEARQPGPKDAPKPLGDTTHAK